MVGFSLKSEVVGRTLSLEDGLPETWLWRGAGRLKPATDIHLGVGFPTVMPGARGVGDFGIPSVHGEL